MKKATSKKSGLQDIKALNDIVIVHENPVETSYDTGVSATVTNAIKSGVLVIPDAYKDFSEKFPCQGKVIAVGSKCKSGVKVGDEVIYARMGVQRYVLNGKTLCDVRECDIHGILE
jgi:co-chaperonin GroES (HSP10)